MGQGRLPKEAILLGFHMLMDIGEQSSKEGLCWNKRDPREEA